MPVPANPPAPAPHAATGSAARRHARSGRRTPWWDVATWLLVLVVGVGLSAALRRWQEPGSALLPSFVRAWAVDVGPAAAAAAVLAVLVVVGGLRRWSDRLPWPWLLAGAYAVSAAWTVSLALVPAQGLAGRVDSTELIRAAAAVGDDPGGYLRSGATVGDNGLPPGGTLVIWALQHVGLHSAAALGLALALIGCLAVPFVLVAVRSLCHEPAARRLAPVLAIAPYAIWMTASIDCVVLALTAAAIACGTVGSEPDRTPLWAAGAGFLLGTASLVSYVAWLLAAAVVITYFVRRRPLPNLITGIAFLVPLFGAQLAGFVWSSGFWEARTRVAAASPTQSLPAWLLIDLLAVLAVTGPALVASARKVRRTPGWPFLLGAGVGLAFAVLTGLSRGDAERVLLPFLPWLLVAAVAPERRPVSGDPPERTAAEFPALLTAVGAVVAIVWRVAVDSPW
ncbi:MAG: hypothetical protein JWM93_2965 [Frankiales bacterium]|nr:hypothetical protein [Frankiales bacterium]